MIIEGHQRSSLESLWWILLDNPATAYFLNEQEKELAAVRLTRQIGYTKKAAEFHWSDVKKGLRGWKIWAFSFALAVASSGPKRSRNGTLLCTLYPEHPLTVYPLPDLVP